MPQLILVPTPIGNLEDITLRAIRVLKECDYVLAEDTRTTGFLLKHLGIEKKIVSVGEGSENEGINSAKQASVFGPCDGVASHFLPSDIC